MSRARGIVGAFRSAKDSLSLLRESWAFTRSVSGTSAADAAAERSAATPSTSQDQPRGWKPELPAKKLKARTRIKNLRAKYYSHLLEDEGSQMMKSLAHVLRTGKGKVVEAAEMPKLGPKEPPQQTYNLPWTKSDMFFEGSGLPPPSRNRAPVKTLVPPELRPKGLEGLVYMPPEDLSKILSMLRSGDIPHAQLLGLLQSPAAGLVGTLEQAKAKGDMGLAAVLDFSYLELAAQAGKFGGKEKEGGGEGGAAGAGEEKK